MPYILDTEYRLPIREESHGANQTPALTSRRTLARGRSHAQPSPTPTLAPGSPLPRPAPIRGHRDIALHPDETGRPAGSDDPRIHGTARRTARRTARGTGLGGGSMPCTVVRVVVGAGPPFSTKARLV